MNIFERFFCQNQNKIIDMISAENSKLVEENTQLKKQLSQEKPLTIVKKPEFLKSGFMYQPKISVENDYVTLEPKDIYTGTELMTDVCTNFSSIQDTDERILEIWKFVVDAIKYTLDEKENWQFPITTFRRCKGDCEDSAVLFVTLARMSGIEADSVFNVCGLFRTEKESFGHSYPIAKMKDGRWYIFELTAGKHDIPLLFKGNKNYTADWGLSNDKFFGSLEEKNGWQM